MSGGTGRTASPTTRAAFGRFHRTAPTSRAPRQRGQATVELALALPVVVLALLLVIQVAMVARAQILVVNAAREGARAAAVGESAEGAAARTPGVDGKDLTVVTSGGTRPGSIVTVTVTLRARTDVALVGGLVPDPTLTASVAMRVEGPRW